MNRRLFLKNTSLLGASAFLAPLLRAQQSQAQISRDGFVRRFVSVSVPGGLDATLGLDPYLHQNSGTTQQDVFIEYTQDQISPFHNGFLGPALSPMLSFINQAAVINGIFMNATDNGHIANLDYFLAGASDSHAALGVNLQTASKKPNALFFTNTQTPIGGNATSILSASSLVSLDSNPSFIHLNEFFRNSPSRDSSSQSIIGDDSYQQYDKKLRELSKKSALLQQARDFHFLADAFEAGASNFAHVSLNSGNLDTHTEHEKNHLSAQQAAWEEIATLLKILKSRPSSQIVGGSLLDETTVLVFTEFSRTPALNLAGGKDHNPNTNSALIISPFINSGIFGKSQVIPRRTTNSLPLHVGLAYDFANNVSAPSLELARQNKFEFVTPENISATLARILNVDLQSFKTTHSQTPFFKTMLK